jgi:hypothetical protein
VTAALKLKREQIKTKFKDDLDKLYHWRSNEDGLHLRIQKLALPKAAWMTLTDLHEWCACVYPCRYTGACSSVRKISPVLEHDLDLYSFTSWEFSFVLAINIEDAQFHVRLRPVFLIPCESWR